MSYPYPIPSTPRVISPSPTPSESSEQADGYFTRSVARKQSRTGISPAPEPIREENDGSGSDSSLDKRARARSRSPVLAYQDLPNGSATGPMKRRRMSGLTMAKNPVKKSEPLPTNIPNGNALPPQENGHLSPFSQMKKSWREFSRSPSPLGLIPLHRHYRTLIHKHEIPRKIFHSSIGFLTLGLYIRGIQTNAITPWLLGALVPIASVDLLRHRYPALNRTYVQVCGALMRETEVDGYNGVIWYLLGAYIALKFYPKDVGVMSILLLSWCDTAASTFGRLYGRYTIRLRRGKSLAGSIAAFIAGIIAAAFFWGWLAPRVGTFPDDPPHAFMFDGSLHFPGKLPGFFGQASQNLNQTTLTGSTAMLVMTLCTGLIASVSEFIDVLNWDDNLTIPLFSSAGIWLFLKAFG